MAGNLLDGFGIHPKHDTVSDERLVGSVIRDQFVFGLQMLQGFPP
jgi:hypothetical protein